MAECRTYDEIQVGDSATIERTLTANDLIVFAHASGNFNPMHLPQRDLRAHKENDPVAPSMWVGSLISAVLGARLPGAGTLYRNQSLQFHGIRAHVGDVLTVTVTVVEKRANNVVILDCRVVNQRGEEVVDGQAEVEAPTSHSDLPAGRIPELLLNTHHHFDRLLEACDGLEPLPTAVVVPEDDVSLAGAMLAAREGLIRPILIGNPERIAAVAQKAGEDLAGVEIIAETSHGAAAARAVDLVHEGKARAVMKGHIHSDELLMHVTKAQGGLRTGRRISHVFVMDVPGLDHLLLVTDAAINVSPGLDAKVDITQNAIDLGRALGLDVPRVGVLSAVETVNPKIPSTLDAAALSKMADRGQITGGIVDGPLAMDNAMDMEAARTKGITSLVAGQAQVLVAPNLEAGNILAKELTFVAHAEAAGLVVGAQAPVVLTSRADNEKARLVSCALALLFEHWRTQGTARVMTTAAVGGTRAEAAQ